TVPQLFPVGSEQMQLLYVMVKSNYSVRSDRRTEHALKKSRNMGENVFVLALFSFSKTLLFYSLSCLTIELFHPL
ncbi:MAG: hypothetical protein IJV59_03350, partial [Eubacterium sp.]|nr:hypothetical protein [Eubacterium sp.]